MRPFTATDIVGLTSTAAAQPPAPEPVPERTEPVTLTRRSPEARDAYHEGYAAAMEHMAVALRELAGGAADSAVLNRTLAAFDTPAAPDPTADRAQVRALGER